MAIFNKFNNFSYQLGLAEMNLDTDVIKLFLTNELPAATDTAYDGVTGATGPAEIAPGNGYVAGGLDAVGVWSNNPAGTGELVNTDQLFTAAGGSVGPFRYAVLYDETPVTKHLIGWWDYGSSITLLDGEDFNADFGARTLTVT